MEGGDDDSDEDQEGKNIAAQMLVVSIDIDGQFGQLMNAVEKELSKVCGHDEEEVKAHAGRKDGPRIVMKPASTHLANKLGKLCMVATA